MFQASYPAGCPCLLSETKARSFGPETLTTRQRVVGPAKSTGDVEDDSWAVSPGLRSASSQTIPLPDTRILLNDVLPDRPTSRPRSHRKHGTSDLSLDRSSGRHRRLIVWSLHR